MFVFPTFQSWSTYQSGDWMVMTSTRLYAQSKAWHSWSWVALCSCFQTLAASVDLGGFLFPSSKMFAVASTLRATQSGLSTAQTRVEAIQSSLLEKRAKQIQTITTREGKSNAAPPRRHAWLPSLLTFPGGLEAVEDVYSLDVIGQRGVGQQGAVPIDCVQGKFKG